MRIAIVGVESTGKSFLAGQLSQSLKMKKIDEVAREYLTKIEREYNQNDLDMISEITFNRLSEYQGDDVILDTDWLVLKVWSEVKYRSCSLKILNHLSKIPIDLYLLMNIDLPYEQDSLREHPDIEDRKRLHEIYKAHLSLESVPFGIVSGVGDARLNCALKIIQSHKPA